MLNYEDLLEIIKDLGISIYSETSTDIIAFCPWHSNTNTPSLNISKVKNSHLFQCWNAACAKKGNINKLISLLKGYDDDKSDAYIKRYRPRLVLEEKEKREYSILDRKMIDILEYDLPKLTYARDRGFTSNTVRFFGVGFSQGMLCIPCYDEQDELVGFVRRVIRPTGKGKYFDRGLPKKYILFNLQNAKEHDDVIVVEGPLDAMKVHQAGFPNVVAVMSGHLSSFQADLLRKFFRSVIIFTDNDEPGRALGKQIERETRGMKIYWVPYLNQKKDPGSMEDKEIRRCIERKKSNILYRLEKNLGGNNERRINRTEGPSGNSREK